MNLQPLYKQIIEAIKLLIDEGALQPHQALPSTRRLAKTLGVNRSTVVRAYEELQALAYLHSQPGSYNRVRKRYKEVAYDPGRRSIISWSEASNDQARKVYEEFLRYYPLREQIARRLRLHSISVSDQEILITSGTQQAIDLIIRMLVEPGGKVLIESPTYAHVIPLLTFNRANIMGIPMKEDGLDLRTFSKALFPGLRIGWVTADRECIDRLRAIKRFSDLSTNHFSQIILSEFLRRGYYELHLKRLHRIFRRGMQLALKTMEETFPEKVTWTRPAGGYTIWVKTLWKLGENELHKIMSEYRVAVSSGRYYFPRTRTSEFFRISIAKINEDEIEEGITRLGKALWSLSKRKEQCF